MLSDFKVSPVLAVKDLSVGTEFYGGVLGLQPVRETDNQIEYAVGGGGTLEVYVSDYAGTNRATAASWEVTSLEDLVEELKTRGVSFEHYDFPQGSREGDIHILDDMKAVWFKDPDGNILCLHED